MVSYTAKYTKISAGYMGQLVEWPEVVTEGRDLEDCRKMLRDALKEMVLAYQQRSVCGDVHDGRNSEVSEWSLSFSTSNIGRELYQAYVFLL
jgi:predicted RNase H-like HicB family nuclease